MTRLLLLALLAGCGGPTESKPTEKAVEKPKTEDKAATGAAAKADGAPAAAPKATPGQTAFAEAKVPFTTAYPDGTMSHLLACTDKGCEVTFQAKTAAGAASKESRIVFQVPAAKKTADELYAELVTGPEGLLKKNPGWKKGAESGGNPGQPWLRKVLSFEDGKDAVGRVMVGEASTGAFLITERLATAELEAARPAIAALYANLKVQ